MGSCVRVKQQLVGIEAVAGLGLIGAVHAKPVKRRRADVRHVAVEHFVGPLGKFEASDFAAALGIEEANLDPRRIRREHGKIRALLIRRRAERVRLAFADLHSAPWRRS